MGKVLDIVRLLPKKILDNRKIDLHVIGNEIILKRFNSKPVKISRHIKIDDDLGVFTGLILTEGLQSKKYKSNFFALMNTDSDIIACCLLLLNKKFQLPLDAIKFKIYIPPSLKQKYKRIEKIWREKLELSKSISIRHYIQKDLKKPKFSIAIYRTVFRFAVDEIIQESLRYIKKNKEFRAGFLKGVFAAEGSIELRNNNLHFVYFSQCNDQNRELIKQALHSFSIKFTERLGLHSKDVRVSHLHNFEILAKLNICSISKIKQERFEEGLLNLKKSPHAGRSVKQTKKEIIALLSKNGPLTVNQIAHKLNMSYYTIWDHIFRIKSKHRRGYSGMYHQRIIKIKYKNKKEKLVEVSR